MPTYQYSCTECGHFFETFQSFSEDSLTVCPECEGRLRKVFNAVGVVFKGSGFYRNDSRGAQSTSDGAAPASTSSAAAKSTTSSPSTSKEGSKEGSSAKPVDKVSTTS
ncbi:MAG: FmdB family zinc ribbon protein [Marmoricola sp.]